MHNLLKLILSLLTLIVTSGVLYAKDDSIKLLDRLAYFHLKDGKPTPVGGIYGMDIDANNAVTIQKIGNTNNYCWNVPKEESVAFSIPFTEHACEVRAEITFRSEESGKAQIRWNGKNTQLVDLANTAKVKIELTPQSGHNELRIITTEGTIGIVEVKFTFQQPYPTWEYEDDVKATLTAPAPGTELSGAQSIDFSWTISGSYQKGWIKLEYRSKDQSAWVSVPGAEGFSPGSKNWPSNNGQYSWNNPSIADGMEFRIVYQRGSNPVAVRAAVVRDLLKIRWDGLQEMFRHIDTKIWKKYDQENFEQARKLRLKWEGKFANPESNSVSMDQETMLQDLGQLSRYYFDSILTILRHLPQETNLSPQVQDNIVGESDKFIEKWEEARVKAEQLVEAKYPNERTIAQNVLDGLFCSSCFSEFERDKNKIASDAEWNDGKKAGKRKILEIEGVEYAFRWCPPGTFTMGSPESGDGLHYAEPPHQVTLTKGFWMLETEVTQEMWESVIVDNPSYFKGKRLPVESVSWDACQAFIEYLNLSQRSAGRSLRFSLPTEAQWEYACRAGTATPFHFGGVLNGDQANCDGNFPYGTETTGTYLEKTAVVGSYPANAWGLHDMHGNVLEWCSDWHSAYPRGAVTDPVGLPSDLSARVFRGGSWNDYAETCRSANRNFFTAVFHDVHGLRLSLVSESE